MTARLKEVEIIGFKSFAQKITVEFAPGITAVVGPNGCGKSNIVEAIRWVLGEQAPGWLRSKAMTDVIFNGTPNRPGIGRAEVVLRLNNPRNQELEFRSQKSEFRSQNSEIRNPQSEQSEIQNPKSEIGIIPNPQSAIRNPQSEIEIKRRLFRSGESQYFLNNRPCRLKDIQEVILDTGLSEKGYFLMEQGKVDSILRSNPIERRHVFEEAAGIKAYQTKKIEAVARLAGTDQNLLRLNDILSELERQEKSLYRQVKKAEQYKKLKSRIRELEIKLNTARYHYLKTKETGLADKIDQLRDRLAGIEKNTTELEINLKGERDRREKNKSVLFISRESLDEDKEQHHQLEKLVLSSKERLSSLEEKGGENQVRIERTKKSIERHTEQILSQKRAGERIEAELKEKQANLAKIEAQSGKAEEELAEKTRELEGRKADLIDYLNETARIKRDMVNLSKEEKRKKGEAEAVRQRKTKEESRRQDLTQKVISFKEKVKAREEKIEQGRGLTSELKKKREVLSEELCKLDQEVNSLKVQLEASSAKLNTINELENSLAGYSEGTKSVLKADLPGVRGLIADFISVPAEYETALEAVLDRALEAVVVETTEQAADILTYLQENSRGRVTLFPIADCGLRIVPISDFGLRISDCEVGIIGRLRDLLKVDSSCQALMDFLLADVLVVQDIKSAIEIIRNPQFDVDEVDIMDEVDRGNPQSKIQNPKSKIRWVTLDGTIITPWGMIQGGKGKGKETGLLARRRIAGELATAIDKIKNHLRTSEQKREEVSIALAEIDKQLRTTQAELKAAEMERVALAKDIEASENLLDSCRSHLEQLVVEEKESGHEVEALRKENEDLTGQCEAREQDGREQEARIGNRQQELDHRQKQLKQERESLNQTKISLAVLTQQSKEAAKTISRLNKEREQWEKSLRDMSGKEAGLKEEREKEGAALLAREQEMAALVKEIAGKESALTQQQQEKNALDQRCRQIENEMDSLRKKGLSIKDEIHSLDLERAKVEVEASSLRKLLINELGVSSIADCGLRIAESSNQTNQKSEIRNPGDGHCFGHSSTEETRFLQETWFL
ncbi:MAG: AAA family ATPase, partial [bacterium]|nr:AAA family ATPase [bacterium]